MTSESKLGPFSIGNWSEKRSTSLLLKDTTSEGKIEGQNVFAIVKRTLAKVKLAKKIWGASGTLSINPPLFVSVVPSALFGVF